MALTVKLNKMKRIALGFVFGMMCSLLSWGQDEMPYTAEVFTDVYVPLENGLSLNLGELWDVPIVVLDVPFSFPCFGSSSDLLRLTDVGGGIEAYTEEADGSQAFHLISGTTMDISDILIVEDSVEQGSIHLHTTVGESPDRIFKLEFNNVGFDYEMMMIGAAPSTANFQIWLYENGTIEIHYGPNTVTDISEISFWSSMSAGLSSFYNWELFTANFFWANGGPGEPDFPLYDDVEFDLLQASEDFTGWTAWPEDGQVYRFNYNYTSVGENSSQDELLIYPNPASDKITIACGTKSPVTVTIVDQSGKRVLQSEYEGQAIVDVGSWDPGVYTVRVDGARNGTFIVQ
tara:strand:+ start:683 stop:1720 length:1038 start_codon:yes stop_codon:yes gene_type:complete